MASMRVTLLLVLVLGLAVQGFARKGKDHDRHRRRSHWERSKYCPEDRDCPQFRLEKKYDEYSIRTFRSARWAVTEEMDEKYEIAYLKATARLRMYLDGHNDEHDSLKHTTPVVAHMRVNRDSATTQKNYTFAMYLPDRYQGRHGHRAPAPLDPSIQIAKWERDTLFVRPFPGFATEATILNQMNEFVDVLEDDKRDYEEESVWVAVYHPPTRLWDRHNEILMEASPRKHRCAKRISTLADGSS
ncbi:hypothetical protein N2152v2_001311 [Parachlorella kessleri]